MNNKESNFISAVVYLHQGETNTFNFLNMINSVLTDNFKKYEIICVDDGVDEVVIDEVRKFKAENTETIVSIVKMGFQHGLEAAMNAGIDLSIGDFVFEFDSCYIDYKKELILQVYRKALEGFDIVTAVPPKKQSKVSSRMFYSIFNHFSDSEEKIMTERFVVISRRAINRVSAYSKTIPYRKAVYASCGLNLYNMEYDVSEQRSGVKVNDEEKGNTAIDSLILFTNVSYKVSMTISVIMAIFMIIAGTYTVVSYFGINKPVAGWAPIMGLIAAGFFAIFVILTIIIKYLDVLLRLIFKRQKYLVSSIEKL